MMAADYRHIGGRENRLGRHYSRFSPFWPTPALSGQSLALRKLCDAGSNRRSQVPVAEGVENAADEAVARAEGVRLFAGLPPGCTDHRARLARSAVGRLVKWLAAL